MEKEGSGNSTIKSDMLRIKLNKLRKAIKDTIDTIIRDSYRILVEGILQCSEVIIVELLKTLEAMTSKNN